jgi:alpha-ketoglutarate-dependent taurine dioxygenase
VDQHERLTTASDTIGAAEKRIFGQLETMLAVVDENEVPFNTFYGDGAAIEPTVMDEIRDAYDNETVKFDWERGTLLLVDNMLVAHGREPFTGDRKVLVAMAEPFKEYVRGQ